MDIELSKKAEKELDKIPDSPALRISGAILKLKQSPFPHGYQKLGNENSYRVRVGDYRIVYTFNKDTQTITVIRVRHRKDVYR